jgi:hypothetical protein
MAPNGSALSLGGNHPILISAGSTATMDYGPRDAEDEHVLLHEPDLMLALLRVGSQHPARLEDALQRLLANRATAQEPPPADLADLRRRLEQAASLLMVVRAIAPTGPEQFQLTDRGHRLLADHPDGVDASVLRHFPEFRAWLAARQPGEPDDDPRLPAYTAGLRAFGDGRSITDNPHPFDHPDHLAWENGWSSARDR